MGGGWGTSGWGINPYVGGAWGMNGLGMNPYAFQPYGGGLYGPIPMDGDTEAPIAIQWIWRLGNWRQLRKRNAHCGGTTHPHLGFISHQQQRRWRALDDQQIQQ